MCFSFSYIYFRCWADEIDFIRECEFVGNDKTKSIVDYQNLMRPDQRWKCSLIEEQVFDEVRIESS